MVASTLKLLSKGLRESYCSESVFAADNDVTNHLNHIESLKTKVKFKSDNIINCNITTLSTILSERTLQQWLPVIQARRNLSSGVVPSAVMSLVFVDISATVDTAL
ncbi:uncharacterized protein [Procambarus clarkii]|uniref:uncharacterized protein n=1 Tax=Procambarus clarkii TaxID=6728 RepID=UPI003744476B